ncbi:MAG: hypothetical protein JWO68_1067, partial [Actinomycetia bacterium]|nr:hypothetical protein [Actinomycetes bacterium]
MAFDPVVPTSDERELLLRFLARQRAEVVATAEGLTDEQAGWTPEGRLLPIIGIVNHLTRVEQRWIDGRYLGEAFLPEEAELEANGRRLAEVVAAYRVRGERTEEVVRRAP